MKATRTRKS